MAYRVLIAEDVTILAELLCQQIQNSDPGAVTCIVSSVQELRRISPEDFDLAVVDLSLADDTSLGWLRGVAASHRQLKTIVLTSSEEDYCLHEVLHTPVAAVVHKSDGLEYLEIAMRAVRSGGGFLSPKIKAKRQEMNADPNLFAKILSPREQDILKLIGDSFSNDEIAQELGIRYATVVDHRKNIMQKLNIHNQADLVSYALETGFSAVHRGRHRQNASDRV
jgi:DNA-binding NarL/FixJ family response regulator